MNLTEKMVLLVGAANFVCLQLVIVFLFVKNYALSKRISRMETELTTIKENGERLVELLCEVLYEKEEIVEMTINQEGGSEDYDQVAEEVMDDFLKMDLKRDLKFVDELSETVLKAFVDGSCRISINGIRKHFNVGYTRAKRILDNLEEMKLVSPGYDGTRFISSEKIKERHGIAA